MRRALIMVGIALLVSFAFLAGAWWRGETSAPTAPSEITAAAAAEETPLSAPEIAKPIPKTAQRKLAPIFQAAPSKPTPVAAKSADPAPELPRPPFFETRPEEPNRERWWIASLVEPTSPIAAALQGSVHWTNPPRPSRIRNEGDPYCAHYQQTDARVLTNLDHAVQNTAVWLLGVAPQSPPPKVATVQVQFDECMLSPRVQLARPGQIAEIVNRDPILHNVHVYNNGKTTALNKGLARSGDEVQLTLETPGIYTVQCDVHPWERAFIMVRNDAAVLTGPDGRFAFDNLHPGIYLLGSWQEAAGFSTRRVILDAGTTTAALDLTPTHSVTARR